MTDDLYEILGVERTATAEEIKARYRKLSKERHPDAGGDADEFRLINNAFEILFDQEKRERYDDYGVVENVDGHAQDALMMMFDELIECEQADDADIKVAATRMADGRIAQAKACVKEDKKKLRRVGRMAKRMRRRDGDEERNLFAQVVRLKEKKLRESLVNARTSQAIWIRVLEMLDELEHTFGENLALPCASGEKGRKPGKVVSLAEWAKAHGGPFIIGDELRF